MRTSIQVYTGHQTLNNYINIEQNFMCYYKKPNKYFILFFMRIARDFKSIRRILYGNTTY